MRISAILITIEKGDSMMSDEYETTLQGFANTEFDFTHSDGLFSSASIQRGKILLRTLGNIDLITVEILWYCFAAKNKISIVDMRNDMQVSATRMTRACKVLFNLGLVNITIDIVDARHRLLSLTEKGKALKLDLLDTLTP
tara:strand:+ start:1478 stop:1900 length:423 start_codon:yes stop_codon:yes gene_type:complete